jgi:hypothetical protein
VYFALAPAVQPFTYNQAWDLVDDHGIEYSDIGTMWARQRNQLRDTRPVSAAGILPGTTLTAVARFGAGRRASIFHRHLDSVVRDLATTLRGDGVNPATFQVMDLGLGNHNPPVPLRSYGPVSNLLTQK